MASAPAEGTLTLELRDVSKSFGPVIPLRSGTNPRFNPPYSTESRDQYDYLRIHLRAAGPSGH